MISTSKNGTWVIVILLLLLIFSIYLKSWIRSSYLALTLPGPTALPLIGNANLVTNTKKLQDIANICYEKYGGMFRTWVSIIPFVTIIDPKDIQVVLGSKYSEKNFIYSLMQNFIGEGLISSNGLTWKLHRKLIQPYFNINQLQMYVYSFAKSAQYHVEKLVADVDTNATLFVNDCVLDILHETILGIRLEDFPLKQDSPFRKGQITLPNRLKKPWFLFDCIFKLTSAAERELEQKSKLHAYTRKILEMRRKGAVNYNIEQKSFLDALIEISETCPDFTDEAIANELCTFMLAGQDSVSAAVAFALHFLAKHPSIQENVVNELNTIFGTSDRQPDANDLKEMTYLEQCIKETLRLCPSVPIFARRVTEDISLGKCVIPAGCNIFISPYATHRLAHIYKNPQEFDPDRFSAARIEEIHSFAYIPFSGGPRNCIGYKFSMLEIKTILSTVLRSYRVSLCPGREFSILYRLTLRAKGGIWLKFQRR